MPELPDLTVYLDALQSRIPGARLKRIVVSNPFLLRTAVPPLASAEGRVVRELRRVGKRIAIGLDGGLWLVMRRSMRSIPAAWNYSPSLSRSSPHV